MGRYGHPRHAESSSYFRRLNRLLVLAAGSVAVLFVVCNWPRDSRATSAGSRQSDTETVAHQSTRVPPLQTSVGLPRLLPFSVIPGGARSEQELANALAHDPVAAAHYAGFDVAHTRVIRVDRGEGFYVSYRIGDRIYWSSKRLYIAAGETLLSDGEHEARTRCGNRLSETPQLPVSPKEPSRAVLNGRPMPLAPAVTAPDLYSELVAPPDLPVIAGGDPGGGRTFFPPFVPIWGDPGTPPLYPPADPPADPPSTPPGDPPAQPAPTPEPSSFLLFSAGLCGMFAVRRKFRN